MSIWHQLGSHCIALFSFSSASSKSQSNFLYTRHRTMSHKRTSPTLLRVKTCRLLLSNIHFVIEAPPHIKRQNQKWCAKETEIRAQCSSSIQVQVSLPAAFGLVNLEVCSSKLSRTMQFWGIIIISVSFRQLSSVPNTISGQQCISEFEVAV